MDKGYLVDWVIAITIIVGVAGLLFVGIYSFIQAIIT